MPGMTTTANANRKPATRLQSSVASSSSTWKVVMLVSSAWSGLGPEIVELPDIEEADGSRPVRGRELEAHGLPGFDSMPSPRSILPERGDRIDASCPQRRDERRKGARRDDA